MRWRDAQTVKHNLRLGDAMKVKLYYLEISHPSNAACLMLDHKGLEYERVDLRPGLQPLVTRLRGFPGITVPALQLDGRRIQGSVPIAHALEELVPEPPLYPPDNKLRAAVRNAEEWCERELQPVPRNLLRWALTEDPNLLQTFVRDLQRFRPAGLVARLEGPAIRRFCRENGGTQQRVREDLDALPAMLDRVEQLLDDEVLGGPQRNAADFQIGTTVRAISLLDDLRPLIEGRPLDPYARAIWPEIQTTVAAGVPSAWLDRAVTRADA